MNQNATTLGVEPGRVITMAVQRASDRLRVTPKQLAAVLGVSTSTISRMSGTTLKPKAAELALLFIRVYRSLIGVVGDDSAAAAWLHSPNQDLDGAPIELVQRVDGLVRTLSYLDAMRAKV